MVLLADVKLNKFFIFNPTRGKREGDEHEKIVYHWSSDFGVIGQSASLESQIQDVCLCEASITFARQFDKIQRHLSMTFTHSKLIVSEIEPNYWIGVSVCKASQSHQINSEIIGTPTSTTTTTTIVGQSGDTASTSTCTSETDPATDSNSTSTSASQQYREGVPDDNVVCDGVLEAFIKNQYRRFCLLRGSILDHIVTSSVSYASSAPTSTSMSIPSNDKKIEVESNIDNLRNICCDYFDSILPQVKLSPCVNNLMELFAQIQYLNLDPLSLMKVNNFTNHLCCLDVNNIAHTLVIFNDQLIWSSLLLDDTRVLFHYMISVMIREALDAELSGGEVEKVRRLCTDQEIFLCLDSPQQSRKINKKTVQDHSSKNKIKYLESCKEATNLEKIRRRPYYMTVFRSSNDLTLCLILRRPDEQLIDKCERFLLGNPSLGLIPMVSLGQTVGQNFVRLNAANNINARTFASGSHSSYPSIANINQNNISNATSSSTLTQSMSSSSVIGMINPQNQHQYNSPNTNSNLLTGIKFAYFDRSIASHKSTLIMRTVDSDLFAKNMRFSKYIMDLEWDLGLIESSDISKNIQVQEIVSRTVSDAWLSAYKSCSRVVYSLQANRNASLIEAVQNINALIKSFQDMML